jgi:DNA-binding transcriptional LysR family regulator
MKRRKLTNSIPVHACMVFGLLLGFSFGEAQAEEYKLKIPFGLEESAVVIPADTEGLQGNSLETIRQMVASGLGVTVLPCSALTKKYTNKRLIAIDLAKPVPGRRIGLAWRRGFTRPQVIDVIRDAIRGLKMPGLSMVPGEHRSA